MTSDGHRLRQSWSDALNDALTTFRNLLTSGQSTSWKRVPIATRENSSSGDKGKGRALLKSEGKNVSIHRRSTKSGDVYRVILDVPADEEVVDLDAWKAVLVTPELRQEWDPAVESSSSLEMLDPSTRIVKTKFTLGWPANPRDAVMISRIFSDTNTVIDVSTSLPRSPDEPSYLRPSPPYVRSHVDLFAWCVQLTPPLQRSPADEPRARRSFDSGRLRITCFWHHDLKTVWNIGAANSIPQQLSATIYGLIDTIKKRRVKVPTLSGYGLGVAVERSLFDVGRDALTLDYAIVPEDPEPGPSGSALHGLDELHARKEQRRLQRAVEVLLPSGEGWDIRISTRASSEAVAQLPWATTACRLPDTTKVCLQVKHSSLLDDHSALKVKLIIEYSGVLKGIRLNGLPHVVEDIVNRDLKSFSMSDKLLRDASSAANVSISTNTSLTTVESEASSVSSPRIPPLLRTDSGINAIPRGPAFNKSILARVRRNYIYFSSLLQEPEAKWKRNTEFRGVSVTQLDSIDPTLVVYKAEATFVGIGLWDLYSAVVTPGARAYWDKLYDDASLLEDVNELSELWHYKTKPAWPVTSRDAVVLKTVYKSPTTVHVFGFSMDDVHMFPSIPPADMNTIRVQIDLQGWAIEALSPTTTQLTLLEQSDPKGWSGKSTIPQQMIANVAGIGEYAIKYGGPPIVTRLGGAKCTSSRFDHERGVFRVEYVPSSRQSSPVDGPEPGTKSRQNSIDGTIDISIPQRNENSSSASVECELRCDVDTWATSLDIVIDPPPQSITCLRRHRLSVGGGGLWLTVGHDIPLNSEERLHIIVRRAPFTAGKEKGVVMVNGTRISVDVEELPESEVKSLSKQKRVKPIRIPLDQPPVLGVIRRRRAEWGADSESGQENGDACSGSSHKKQVSASGISFTSSAPKIPSPLSNFFTNAMEQARSTTQQAVAALSPPVTTMVDASFPQGKLPIHFALDALSFAQSYHRGSLSDNWTLVTDKGIGIHRRVSPEVSPAIPVHKGERVIEGFTAEEVASVVFSYDCRKHWDDRFGSVCILEEFGSDCHTAFLTTKGGFPFRDRGFYLSSLLAREDRQTATEGSSGVQSPTGVPSAIYCISASFNPDSAAQFSPLKYNPYTLPIGRTFIDAWVLQTLDPYTSENYAIPSTKCTRLAAFDYAGSIPVAVNSMINSALPRSILAVESYLRKVSPFPEMKIPAPGFRLKSDIVDATECSWRLYQGSQERVLLESKLESESKTFRGIVAVSFSELPSSSFIGQTDDSHDENPHDTPRPNKTRLPSRPTSPDGRHAPVDSESTASPTRRRRGISSASVSMTPPGSLASRSRSNDRLRTSSSAFSLGRVSKRHSPTDFIVAEVVVDVRTYPQGYDVRLASRVDNKDRVSKPVLLSMISDESPWESPLPISYSLHVLPPSPLYTSSSGVETPVRHLLRLTLPTTQFEVPTVEDPLTGEVHSAPAKPQWYRDLESKDKQALVRLEVKPLVIEKEKQGKRIVLVNDVEVLVGGEKESFKSSAAEEASISVLSRVHVAEGGDALALPKQLSVPVAIADNLLNVEAAEVTTSANLDHLLEQGDDLGLDANAEDSEKGDLSQSSAPLTPVDEKTPGAASDANRGFFSYFSAYQGSLPFLRSKSSSSASLSSLKGSKVPGALSSPKESPPHERTNSSAQRDLPSESMTGASNSSTMSVIHSVTAPRFSVSTLIAAAIIAFLLGSLLRSLLSPADFIYVVTDLGDVPAGVTRAPGGGLGDVEPGWREIKRLVELKYILGGWDFQIAAVRRH